LQNNGLYWLTALSPSIVFFGIFLLLANHGADGSDAITVKNIDPILICDILKSAQEHPTVRHFRDVRGII
jgi:hypothetical protein